MSIILGLYRPNKKAGGPPPLPGQQKQEEPAATKKTQMNQQEQEHDMDDDGIPPEAVAYHTGDENCGVCSYMAQDGMCSKLKMVVGEADHCQLFMPGRQQKQSMAEPGSEKYEE
jgi:hypothetical protein